MQPKVIYNQNLLDIAIQEYGDPCAAFDLAIQNKVNITDALPVGFELKTPISNYLNNDVLEYFKRKGIQPATGATTSLIVSETNTTTEEPDHECDGIFWQEVEW